MPSCIYRKVVIHLKNELIIKKCNVCGAMMNVLADGKVICCGQEMTTLVPNSVDCAIAFMV